MANETFSATQTTVLTSDVDNDGQIDPGGPGVGDTVTTTVTITNNSDNTDATGVTFSETLQGMTLVDQTGDDINASPIAFDDADYATAGNVSFTAAVSVLTNDAEPLGPEGLLLNTGTALQNTGVAFATSQGGSVTLNADGTGTFTYVSAVGFEGTDTFTYTLRDTGLDGVAGNTDDLTGTGTVSITVGPSVWFIDNSFAVNGNGTQASPFNSIAAFNAAQGQPNGPDSGDFIYLRFGAGTYSEADGINLADGQTLIGNGDDLVVNLVTIEVGSAGLTPTIQVTGAGGEGVLLASNNTLSGFNISTTNAAADGIEDGGGTVGTLTISNVSISGTGQAVDIDAGGTLAVTLDSVTSTGASEEGIQLAGVAGSFTATTVSLNGMTGDGIDLDGNSATVAINGGSIGNSNDPGGIGVDVNGGAGNVTISATINKLSAGAVEVVEVTGRTGGTVDFNANITSSGGGGGIDINANTGGTVRFDGGMNLSTGTAAAFNASGNTSTTVVVTDTLSTSNILTTTTGTALNVANTTIGAEGLTFQSISANGAASGIILNTTGSTGAFTVTGTDGADAGNIPDAGTGGTITNTTGNGISLTNANNVSLGGMTVSNTGAHGINVSGGSNLTLTGTQVTNAGNADDEHGLNILNTTGTVALNQVTFDGAAEDLVRVETTGTLALNVTNGSQFSFPISIGANAGNAFELAPSGSGSISTSITDSFFDNIRGDSVNLGAITLNANGTQSLTFSNNDIDVTLAGRASGIAVSGQELTTTSVTINNNNFDGAGGNGVINLDTNDGATTTGNITNNTIANSPGHAMVIAVDEHGTSRIRVDNNAITNAGGDGIQMVNFGDAGADEVSTMDMIITNNTINGNGSNSAVAFVGAINFTAFDTADVNRINIEGNLVTGTVTTPGNPRVDYYVDVPVGGNTTFEEVPNTAETNLTATYLRSINVDPDGGGAGVASVSIFGTVPLSNGVAIPLPLFAASGGVEAADTGATDGSSGGDLTTQPPADDTPDTSGNSEPPAVDDDPDPAPAHRVIVDDGVLTQAELDYFVDAAIARWSEAGLSEAQIDALEEMSFGVADMSGLNLGSFSPTQITLDADAAGRGWYLDGTPLDDTEFGTVFSATWLQTDPTGAPAGHYDLLTTVMHEMGHTLGIGDSYASGDRGELMYGWLYTGERRLPSENDADGAVAGSITSEEFLGAPLDIGVLPFGKSVTIQWQATINAQNNQLIVNPVNQGTVTETIGVAFPDKLTDDPAVGGANDPNITTLDTLSLGNLVFNDVNKNGLFDAGDSGVNGVILSLFVDADNNNVIDNEAAPLATATTAGGGLYSFAGLAPGNYIVRVDLANFQAGGALEALNLLISSTGNPDPDDNVNDDDNGSRALGAAAYSQTITLAYNDEPDGTPDVDGDADADTNLTLDFGFISNTPPMIAGLAGDTSTFTEDGPAVLLDDSSAPEVAATVTDDQINFIGGNLTVSVTNNGVPAEDVLGFSTVSTVELSDGTNVGSTVSVDGRTIGTVTSNGTGGSNLVVTFTTTDARAANVSTLIQALTYFNSNTNDPSNAARTVSVSVNDGLTGVDSENVIVNINLVNDAPVLDANQTPALGAVDEDAGAPGVGSGTLISSLVDVPGGGGNDNVNDPDGAGALTGIALTGVSTTSGTWLFTINGGTSWTPIDGGTLSDTSALLLAADANTRLYFQPSADFNGTVPAAITFRAWDQSTGANGATGVDTSVNGGTTAFSGATDTAAITVNAVADIVADTLTTTEDNAVTANVITGTNGASADNFEAAAIIQSVTQGTNGGVTFLANGEVTYTPNADFNGVDTFQYTVLSGGLTETATVTVNIGADADIVGDGVTVGEDSATNTLDLLFNDTFENTNRSITAVGVALNGTTAINDNGTPGVTSDDFVTYTPNGNYSGPDSFTYTVTSNGTTEQATVNVTVSAVADTPSVTNAVTNEDNQTAAGLVISRNAADGPEVTHFKITGITNGTLFQNDGTTQINDGDFITFAEANAGLKFTPAQDFNGVGSFQAQASTSDTDAGLGGSLVTANITVNPVNDDPVVANAITDQTSPSNAEWVFQVPANAFNDVDGDVLTHTASLGNGDPLPAWLIFNGASRTFTGTPPLDFVGQLALKVTASDASSSVSDTFNLDIVQSPSPDINLSEGDDNFIGTGLGEVINGLGGNDNIQGGAGNDRINGNAGNDNIDGGSGANVLHGNDGGDRVIGIGNLNTSFGDDGADQLFFIGNQNQLYGGEGNDWHGVSGNGNALAAGAGNDFLGASGAGNTLAGQDGTDFLFAVGVGNALHGETGNDWLGVSGSINTLFGGADNDWLGATGNGNTLDGGTGNDTLVAGPGSLNALFVFHAGYGIDEIVGFNVASGHVVNMETFGLANFSALQPFMSQVGADVVITINPATILTMHNVNLGTLGAGQFDLV